MKLYRWLDYIRLGVYKMGFRPKPNTVLFSPSLSPTSDFDMKVNFESFIQAHQKPSNLLLLPSDIKLVPVTMPNDLLYRAGYCIICSTELTGFITGVKACPNGCGQVLIQDTDQGTPILVFELNE